MEKQTNKGKIQDRIPIVQGKLIFKIPRGEKCEGKKTPCFCTGPQEETCQEKRSVCSEFSPFLLSHHVQINTGFENPCSGKPCARRSFPKAQWPIQPLGFALPGLSKTFPGLCTAPVLLTRGVFSALAFNLLFVVTCSQRRPYSMGTPWEWKHPLSQPASAALPATCPH